MTTHQLKTHSKWFQRVASGEKTAEIRAHDRDFQVGDILDLIETWEVSGYHVDDEGVPVHHSAGEMTGASHDVVVTHVLPAAHFKGLAEGYCLLSIRPRITVGKIRLEEVQS